MCSSCAYWELLAICCLRGTWWISTFTSLLPQLASHLSGLLFTSSYWEEVVFWGSSVNWILLPFILPLPFFLSFFHIGPAGSYFTVWLLQWWSGAFPLGKSCNSHTSPYGAVFPLQSLPQPHLEHQSHSLFILADQASLSVPNFLLFPNYPPSPFQTSCSFWLLHSSASFCSAFWMRWWNLIVQKLECWK